VLDLNSLLLFVAVLSPLVVLFRTTPRATRNRGWQSASAIVLLVTALAWVIAPECAGYIGGAAWLLLLFFPAVGLRKAIELAANERYASAQRIVAVLRWLHPVPAVRQEFTFFRAIAAAQNGEADFALRQLDMLRATSGRASLQATAQALRMRGDWAGLVAWCRQNLPLVAIGREPGLLPLYCRALGETGAIDELVLQVAARAPALLATPQHQETFDLTLLVMLAFAGRHESLARLCKTRLRGLAADTKEFWIGTSLLAAGETETGCAMLETLRRKTKNALIRADVAHRLTARQPLPVSLNSGSKSTVQRFETNLARRRVSLLAPKPGWPTPAVATFIALNAAMFLLELARGGSTNEATLYSLGALQPFAVLARGEYWRLLSALFLHFGPLHLLVNLYALYVLGPPLESSIGPTRFAVSYIIAGLGSSAGVVALWRLGWTRADLLVGASGAVMGIVGAWGGLLLRYRHLPMARRRLVNIGVIVLMQTAFDFYTPQVSMAAHLCGLTSGLLIGLLLAKPQEA
jgi:rhomboid protease GluP